MLSFMFRCRRQRMTPQSAEPQPSYQQSLARLEESKPRIAHALREADERRIKRLAALADGMRLRGLEQLHVYLDAAAESYASLPPIADIAFLLARVRADFQTALEATLSGYQGVAADAMRDVMEVEGLLLDFAATPANIQEWLQADRRLRMRKYGPAQVRDRLKDAGIVRTPMRDSSQSTIGPTAKPSTSPRRSYPRAVVAQNRSRTLSGCGPTLASLRCSSTATGS